MEAVLFVPDISHFLKHNIVVQSDGHGKDAKGQISELMQ
jgi:hypothetical protein